MTGGKMVIANPSGEQVRDLRFFKVMFGDFGRRMRIPRVFLRRLLEESPDEVNLEGPSGNIWHVKLKRTKDDIFLEQGWEAFKVDHSLAMGEALLFEYDGKKHLKVTDIVSMYGLTRRDIFTVECSQESMSQGNERQVSNLTHVGDRRLDNVIEPNLSMPFDQIDPLSHQVTESILASPNADTLMIDQGPGPGHDPDPKAAALAFTSCYPFFMIQIKSYNVIEPYHLHIPTQFSREHLHSMPKRIFLLNLGGTRWSVRVLPKPTTKLLASGFRNFSRDNNLKVGDYCVFELVNETELKVHIFPRG
ncbi:hypothetical protein Syun_015535 [Stephania yunnanensis]|uniref:TF-B3 domain-containing protein n=1 Tax=Stephania yunnanensis TaxID=152371 RepID=A0AAP0JM74_9MAGN